MTDRIGYDWPDEITQLTDRAEAAEAERDGLREEFMDLLAERDRYRELLREACSFAYWGNRRATDNEAFAMHSRLRRALSEQEQE